MKHLNLLRENLEFEELQQIKSGGQIAENVLELVGNTPLLRLNKIGRDNGDRGELLVKLEMFSPGFSVKDRIGVEMIRAAERSGKLNRGMTIVEPTSGNTGIALAWAAAVLGYSLILVMPDTMSIERRKVLKALGARLELTPGENGMNGALARATEIAEENSDCFMVGQFKNPANSAAHQLSTGPEILRALGNNSEKLGAFVAGVGTGGTITGVGRVLKENCPNIQIIAVEPADSPVLSGKSPGPHKIQGIGAGFIPEVLDCELIDEIITVESDEAGETSRQLAIYEGMLAGISAGANVAAAIKVAARKEMQDKIVVSVLCDSGERYLSTWLYGG